MVSISIIIVNYNARYFLKSCLTSILSSDIIDDIEVIVVDNNSSDGSQEMLKNEFAVITCIENKENLGFSKANNRGAALAQGKYILILNPDTILTETTLSDVLSFSEQQVKFGAAGVRFIDGSGQYLPEGKRNFPDLKVAGAKLLGYSRYYYAHHIPDHEIAETDILTGAFMLVKREVYEQVQGFDENFFMYGEDIDLSYRISKAGYKNFYIGSTKVIHFKGESTVKDGFYLKNFYGALSIFYKKHFPRKKLSYLTIDLMIGIMIRLKSMTMPKSKSQKALVASWLYIGENEEVFDILKHKFSESNGEKRPLIEKMGQEFDVLFLDSDHLSFSDIVAVISNPELSLAKKRIISKDHSFLIGSDRSDERGEVIQL